MIKIHVFNYNQVSAAINITEQYIWTLRKDKKAQLSLRKTSYSLYGSCYSTDLNNNLRSIFYLI